MTEISRRRFAALAALPFLSPALRAQVSAANDPGGHLSIAVEINGRGPFRFVVDTGADTTVLADSTAMTLGLRSSGAAMLAGIVRTVRAEKVDVESISFGSTSRSALSLPVLPRSLLQADGYLGLDGNRVILDFAQRQLIVTDPLPVYVSVYHNPNLIVLHG